MCYHERSSKRKRKGIEMNRNDILQADSEYVRFAPLLEVMAQAVSTAAWMEHDWESYGETIAEIGCERAIDGSGSAQHDAERIWCWERKVRALQNYVHTAPMHRDAAMDLIHSMPL